MMDFGERIKYLRENAGMNQAELAKIKRKTGNRQCMGNRCQSAAYSIA